ncbi:MAG: Mg-protoporphyrin IX monomethyl ester oxidative cyclase, partial [Verrucomicrobiales bacterium]
MSSNSTEILLTTINATYQHCAFGLRYLYANLEELKARTKIVEFTIQQKPRDMVETLLAHRPKIIGLG